MRSWPLAAAFAGCAALLLAAMGWITWTTLDLERAREETRREAEREETVRLALWRIDSVLAPLIAAESGRPYSSYSAFYSPGDFLVCEPKSTPPPEVLVASPLLTDMPPYVRLHFQYREDGVLESPQVPAQGAQLDAAKTSCDPALLERAIRNLELLGKIASKEALLGELPRPGPAAAPGSFELEAPSEAVKAPLAQSSQTVRNTLELNARQRAYDQIAANNNILFNRRPPPPREIIQGVMKPLWMGGELILARRTLVSGAELIQGCWLDWSSLEREVLAGVKDILPGADIVPVAEAKAAAPSRLLVSIPAAILPGVFSDPGTAPRSPVRFSLLMAWCCILAASLAVGTLLFGVAALSERRGAFVSAVTHELRTPLTTFRMYTEMLSKGMVADPSARDTYLQTLSREADRLGHLVDNVLAYARLERRGSGEPASAAPLGDILERARGRLAERAEQSDMILEFAESEDARGAPVQADPVSVEQVLLNLVDNACKYAGAASDRRIHLVASTGGGKARIEVTDHGPGIPRGRMRGLFRPFSKSAAEAARSSPGVGLGLALSRRIARKLGGDLRHEGSGKGASFVLELPLARG